MAGHILSKWRTMASLAHYNSAELAILCKLSSRQLQRQFKRHLGCSPQQWLDSERLADAQKRLLAGDRIKEIAWELGFSDSSHFCHHFKAALQVTPTEFVAMHSVGWHVAQRQQMSLINNDNGLKKLANRI